MRITKEDMIQTRITLLKQMDSYIRDNIGDEEAFEQWFAYGVPDEATNDDYRSIAEDTVEWTVICEIFGSIMEEFG